MYHAGHILSESVIYGMNKKEPLPQEKRRLRYLKKEKGILLQITQANCSPEKALR